ncbi:MAG: saccharopine dehydrogenase family protein [Candidatus Sericytochromatia bacterium]
MSEREFDVILYGASGFTGRQCARYFAEQVGHRLNWALAGRNRTKLVQVRNDLGEAFADIPLLEAEASDRDALQDLAERTQVVLTTAGPFARYGEKLVAACVEAGTDYVDITGETPWVRHLIDTYHADAEAKGVRIVPFCGVDSIPSDLSVCNLAQMTEALLGEGLVSVQGLFQMRGGFNGGTLASMLNMIESGQMDLLEKPYLLNPDGMTRSGGPADQVGVRWDPHWWTWTAPFVMAPVNTRVVRRSEALYRQADQAYGPENFQYQEAAWANEILPAKSLLLAGAQLALSELVRLPAVLKWVKAKGPQPGEGPSEASMDGGFLSAWFRGTTTSGQVVTSRFFCEGDPGNRVTVKLLCESALLLAEQRDDLPESFPGGVLTPATGLGTALVDRLQDAGVQIDITLGDLFEEGCSADCDCAEHDEEPSHDD